MATHLILPTEASTAGWLTTFFWTKLRVPRPLALRWVTALMASNYTRSRELRAYLAAHQPHRSLQVRAVLRHPCTPPFLLRLLEDLVHEGLLTRQDSTTIEDHLLARITRAGEWTLLTRKGDHHAV